MICLCCGKEIRTKESSKNGWHDRCIRSFFNTDNLPELDVSEKIIEEMALANIDKRLTVAGVQKKISLHLSGDNGYRLTVVDYPTGYILKPQTKEYDFLPEYEQLSMLMADATGIRTVPHALIKTGKSYSYITRRIDRKIVKNNIEKYAMEDFCQLAEKLAIDKYKGSYEQCGKIIKLYSSIVGFDLSELFIRLVFSYVIGNSDMHLKNFSLIETEPGSREYHLSGAYDMLPVNIVLPEDDEEMALMLNGKKKNLRKKDFIALADNYRLNEKTANKLIDSVCSKVNIYNRLCDESLLNDEGKKKIKNLIEHRIGVLCNK
ncbi:MAG: HipA domain-containing protein [Eubacterium sp.]|nr:HipA domain-containing protein [Eubacterium sp.]